MPKKFRQELGNESVIYIVLGQDGELWGFNSNQWLKEAEERLKIRLGKHLGRVQRREFFPQALQCNLDSQGRFILPQEFIDYATLNNGIVLVGAGDHFEIWNEGNWQKMKRILKI